MSALQRAESIRRALGIAARQRKEGQLDTAERTCREILKADASSGDALYLLAAIAQDRRQPEAALAWLDKAIAANPRNPAYRASQGAILRSLGRLDEAFAAYEALLTLQPESAEAQFGIGNVLRDKGRRGEAQARYRRALELKADHVPALSNLGALLQTGGDLEAAKACYRRVLELNADAPEALNNLGVIAKGEGRNDEAMRCYERALALRPAYPEARYNLGNALKSIGRYAEAAACYEEAIRRDPAYADAYTNLGNVRKEAGRFDEALALYGNALALKPRSAEALHNVGIILRERRQLDAAAEHFRKAIAADPNFAEAYAKLGNVLQDRNELAEAAALYREALARGPALARVRYALAHALQMMCDWKQLPELGAQLRASLGGDPDDPIDPFALVCLPSTLEEQQRCAMRWTARFFAPVAALHEGPALALERAQKEKLRIGYLSGDFRAHVVGVLVPELFERHDRGGFEVFAYAYGADDGSPQRARIARAVDHFIDVDTLSFDAAARRIHADGIDILVDLTGHTRGTRSQILALRPAPVQVSYLGYPGTLGGAADYIVADRFILPPASAGFFSEKPAWLPHSYQVNDRTRAIGAPASRAAHGLPEDGFVFCCFNQSFKILPEVFGAWMRILQQTPRSVLWLGAANRWAEENLRREAGAHGVDPARLVFARRLKANSDHLARLRLADLFLDTLPYNAHATASDALWVGLPVLTCAGETFAGRVAGSLLRAAGLPELVTASLAEYESLALALARDRERLARIRAQLAANRDSCALFDTPRFVAGLEAAYRAMWARFAAGLAPEAIEVPVS